MTESDISKKVINSFEAHKHSAIKLSDRFSLGIADIHATVNGRAWWIETKDAGCIVNKKSGRLVSHPLSVKQRQFLLKEQRSGAVCYIAVGFETHERFVAFLTLEEFCKDNSEHGSIESLEKVSGNNIFSLKNMTQLMEARSFFTLSGGNT